MDLDGTIAAPLGVSSGVLRIVVLDRFGGLVMLRDGAFSDALAEEIVGAVKRLEVRK
jgi:ethanolamine utilization microcompartment shell protein EutS